MEQGFESRRGDAAWPSSPNRQGPLAGLRVLDLTRILAGPFATMQLADLGADVIKVEAPGRGDETRRWGPPFAPDGTASYYLAINRNKRSLTLDLGDPETNAVARRLARAADVMIDNFLPGRLANFGLDHRELRARNPGLISATISGFGSDNPYSDRPGFDMLAQAMGGMMSITGDPEGPPTRVGVAMSDLVSGLFVNHGILAALHERARTGRGRHVEVSLLDTQVASLVNMASAWLTAGVEPHRFGNHHPSIAPYEPLQTADGPLVVTVGNDRQFTRFVHALGLDELADDPRFATNHQRVEHRAELAEALEERLRTRTRDEWLEVLIEAEVPAAPINTIPEVFGDPVIRDRMVAEVDGLEQVRSPVRLDGEALPVDRRPPELGADTEAILTELGIPADDLTAMRERNAI